MVIFQVDLTQSDVFTSDGLRPVLKSVIRLALLTHPRGWILVNVSYEKAPSKHISENGVNNKNSTGWWHSARVPFP